MIVYLLLLSIHLSLGQQSTEGLTACPFEESNSVRLNNEGVFASTMTAGRVEICRCSDSTSCYWETVSTGSLTDPFSWKNSIVVCRELDFFDVQSPILQSTVSKTDLSPSAVPIYETTFNCDGSESSLHDCQPGLDTAGLTHSSDAYLMCQSSITVNKVRLTGTTIDNAGIVEIYYSRLSRWATVCHSTWSSTDVNTLCTSLGYASGTYTTYNTAALNGPEISNTPDLSVSCLGSSLFSQCTFTQISSCNNGNGALLAGAICTSGTGVREGSVRTSTTLTSSSSFDRLEVFYNGRWGTVCDTHWDTEDGQVACRELGNRFDSIPSSPQIFNSLSSRPIYILAYSCAGHESNLTTCPSLSYPVGFVTADCSHSNDAGLLCERSSSDDSGSSVGSSVAGVSFFLVFGIFVVIFLCMFFKDVGPVEKFCNCLSSCFGVVSSCCDRVMDCLNSIRECDCDCTCISCPTVHRHRNNRRPNPVVTPSMELVNTQPRRSPSTSSSSSSSDSNGGGVTNNDCTTGGTSRNDDVIDKRELTEKAPPTYNDALRLNHVEPPPEYKPPPQNDDPLPYPVVSNFDPAHPPPLPLNSNHHEYPPPTLPDNIVPDEVVSMGMDPPELVSCNDPPYPVD